MKEKEIMRIGKISSINYEKGTARITYEDKDQSTTAEMSFLAWQYWMPRVGDQVLVAHLSTGTSTAVILGPVWHDGNRPVEGFEGLYRKEFANETGKANERYDARGQQYTMSITGSMETTASGGWMVKAGESAIQLNPDGSVYIVAPKGVTTVGQIDDAEGQQ